MTTDAHPTMLAEWLLAQLDADEAVARAAIDSERPGTHWHWVNVGDDTLSIPSDEFLGREYMAGPASLRTVEKFPTTSGVGDLPSFAINHVDEVPSGPALHIALNDPAHVLAQIAAVRAVVELLRDVESSGDVHADAWTYLKEAVRALAQPYAGRAGWDEGWAL